MFPTNEEATEMINAVLERYKTQPLTFKITDNEISSQIFVEFTALDSRIWFSLPSYFEKLRIHFDSKKVLVAIRLDVLLKDFAEVKARETL